MGDKKGGRIRSRVNFMSSNCQERSKIYYFLGLQRGVWLTNIYFYRKNELLTDVQMSCVFLDTYYKKSKHYRKKLLNKNFWEKFYMTGKEILKFSQKAIQTEWDLKQNISEPAKCRWGKVFELFKDLHKFIQESLCNCTTMLPCHIAEKNL